MDGAPSSGSGTTSGLITHSLNVVLPSGLRLLVPLPLPPGHGVIGHLGPLAGTSLLDTEPLILLLILGVEKLVELWRRSRSRRRRWAKRDEGDGGDPGAAPSPSPSPHPDPDPSVRDLMERLVETLVSAGSGGLDDVALRPAHPHPAYRSVYLRHQPRLRSALTSLAYSLQMAMAQKPLSETETPGRAHAQLRAMVLDLARDVAALPPPPPPAPAYSTGRLSPSDSEDKLLEENNNFASRAYEDLLATAIVNKVMERSSHRTKRRHNSFISSLEVRLNSVDGSADSSSRSSGPSSWTSSSRLEHDLEHLDHDLEADPISLMIEECIEEVATVSASSSSASGDEDSAAENRPGPGPGLRPRRGRGRGVRRKSRRSRRRSDLDSGSGPSSLSGPPSILSGLSFLKQRVPFPELGVDIVDDWVLESELGSGSGSNAGGSLSLSDQELSDLDVDLDSWAARPGRGQGQGQGQASCVELVTPLQSWEDNWLFQSRKLNKGQHNGPARAHGHGQGQAHAHHPVPVPMLVPNPSEDFRALIGDVDAEETSDLSECSDDALQEVILSGYRSGYRGGCQQTPRDAGPLGDPVGDPRGVGEDDNSDPRLAGLAETCNLELLRRAATARASERKACMDQADSEVAVVYETPTRKEARAPVANGGIRHTRNGARHEPADKHKKIPNGVPSNASFDSPRGRVGEPLQRVPQEAPTESSRSRPAPPGAPLPLQDVAVNGDGPRPQSGEHDGALEQPQSQTERETTGDIRSARVPVDSPESRDSHITPKTPMTEQATNHSREGDEEAPSEADPEPEPEVGLCRPPIPGSIAEREHRKWLHATPLENNPYSPENIQRRLKQRSLSQGLLPQGLLPAAAGPTAAATGIPAAEFPTPDTSLDSSLQVSVGSEPDPKKYGRDFYINARTSSFSPRDSSFSSSSRVPRAPASSASFEAALANDTDFHQADCEPEVEVRTNGDGGPEPEPEPEHAEDKKDDHPDDGPLKESHKDSREPLPSVKELAKQFLQQPEGEADKVKSRGSGQSAVSHAAHCRVVIVPKDTKGASGGKDKKAVRHQVHSLTARSMSREFREGLAQGLSAPKVTPKGARGELTCQLQLTTQEPEVEAAAAAARPDPEGARDPRDQGDNYNCAQHK